MNAIAMGLLITSLFFIFLYLGQAISRIMHRSPNPLAVGCRMGFYGIMTAVFAICFLAFLDYLQVPWREGWPWSCLYLAWFILTLLLDRAFLSKILEKFDPRLDQPLVQRIKVRR